ncbi:hypothetical protein J1N51_11420 [Psychrosphaera ytuae]|uniref:Uncharacterized protein n=1 Tax=Psychrosphaera ytuae TaxID=2820710 RepID=A0A975D9Z4_9GAMM|nr:hypothetical protein [Psychrosphaera ytuae]QTH63335.1 hypothetical protein J1N51_11420 [Psychrosphaera ytuae]
MKANRVSIKLFVAVYGKDKDAVKKLEGIIKKLSNTHTCIMPPSGSNMKYGEILVLDVFNDINEPNYAPISEVDWCIQKASEFLVEQDLEFNWAHYSYITVSSRFPVCISEFDVDNNGGLNKSVTLDTDLAALRELSSRGIEIHFDNQIVLNSPVFLKLYWLWIRTYQRIKFWLRPQTSDDLL